MAMSRTKAWVAAGLVARLLMIAVLAMSVQLKFANHTRRDYSLWHNYNQLESYTYAVAAAVVGMAASALQVPVAVYLLCKSKRTTPSGLALDASMYADVVVTAILASGVGAGFGATNDALRFIQYGIDWSRTNDAEDIKSDLTSFFHRGSVAIVFLLIGMVLSVLAAVVSVRIRARASNDLADDCRTGGDTHRDLSRQDRRAVSQVTRHFPLINPGHPRPRETATARAIRPRPPGSLRTSPCSPRLPGPPAPRHRHSSRTLLPTPPHGQPKKGGSESNRSRSGDDGGRADVVPAAAAAQVRAVRVQPARRAPQLPVLPPLALRGPLHPRALRRFLVRVPPPRRRGPRRAPPRRHHRPHPTPPLRRTGPGLAHPRRRARLPHPRPPPRPRRRDAPPAPPRQPPPRLRRRAGGPRRAAGPLVPRARLLRAPLLCSRRRARGLLLVLRRGGVPVAVVGRRRVRRRRGGVGVPRRALLHGLRHLPDHLLPPDPADGGVRQGVREVRRRRHRARAPPQDQGPAQEDQPPLPQVHHLQPRARLRQPVRRAARHHQAARHCQPRHRRRARADVAEPGGGSAGVPPQRGQDHAQDAGHHERGRGVARRRHRPRLRQRPGEPGPGPSRRRGLPGAGERLPPGRRRRVRQRRRLRQPERELHRRPQVRPVPGQQHLLPEAAGAGDVPGEQPGRHHGVRLRGGPGVAPRALHDRVLARHVAAREDGRDIMNWFQQDDSYAGFRL